METQSEVQELTKLCIFCAEEIKAEATVCRYCKRDIPNIDLEELEKLLQEPEIIPETNQPMKRFFQTCLHTFIRPFPKTFGSIETVTNVDIRIMFIWVFISTMVFFLIDETESVNGLWRYGFRPLIAALLETAVFGASTLLLFRAAKLFKGEGSQDQLIYALGSFYVVVTLLSVLVGIPFMIFAGGTSSIPGLVGFLLTIYAVVLYAVVIMGAMKLKWWQAFLIVIPWQLLYGLFEAILQGVS